MLQFHHILHLIQLILIDGYNSSLRFNFESKIFNAFFSHSLNNFRVIKIFFTKTKYLIALIISINFYDIVIFVIFI